MKPFSRLVVLAGALAIVVLAAATPADAGFLTDPADSPPRYQPWIYPAQLPTGAFEQGDSPARGGTGFLTLPFAHPRFVTSIFDHCRPDYSYDGRVCRFDGAVAAPAKGIDPKFGGGYSTHPGASDYLYYEGHDGLDYGLYYESVLAAADGVVTFAGWDKPGCEKCGYGRNVFISHRNGFMTRYGHLDSIAVGKGQAVRRGQVLGMSGNSGSSTGAHLHFGVYREAGAVPVDPYGWQAPGADPWPRDAGNLWLGGAPRFPEVPRPAPTLSAVRNGTDPSLVDVAWGGSGVSGWRVEVVTDEGPAQPLLESGGPGSTQYRGATGHAYWFLTIAQNDLGWTAAASSSPVLLPDAVLEP